MQEVLHSDSNVGVTEKYVYNNLETLFELAYSLMAHSYSQQRP